MSKTSMMTVRETKIA